MTPEERLNKTMEPLDDVIKAFKKVIRRTWPKTEAEEFTEAHDNSPDTNHINLNDPSK